MQPDFSARIVGTNIDPRSLLCTDYFNHFNSVIMLFGMLPDMPELLDEVDKWRFMTYVEHFETSGLDFAPLAIEIYPFAPAPLRARFENLAGRIRLYIENARHALHKIYAAGEIKKFAEAALVASMDLQKMVDEGSAIVHGHDSALDQQAIDKLF